MLSMPPWSGQSRLRGVWVETATPAKAGHEATKTRRRKKNLRAFVSPWSRCSSCLDILDFTRGDLVPEVVGIETIEATVRRLGLRVHEEPECTALRSRQHDVVRVVERDAVHLPRPEEPRPRAADFFVAHREMT